MIEANPHLISQKTGKYRETNAVAALAIYQWASHVTVTGMADLFERVAQIVGSKPDHVAVSGDHWRGKGYTYSNFVNRNILHKQEWRAIQYLWKRQPDAIAYAAISCYFDSRILHSLSIQIDEAAVEDLQSAFNRTMDIVIDAMRPLYGIGFSAQYDWDITQFLLGQGSGYTGPTESLPYHSREAFNVRGGEFGNVLISAPSALSYKFRDIFPINLISAGHLLSRIESETLEHWIAAGKGNRGKLRKLADLTWRWDVPQEQIMAVRQAISAANLMASGDSE